MEMWLRFAAHSDVGYINCVQAVYRRHGGNMSLQYTANGRVPDLMERKAAIDSFIRSCGSILLDGADIEDELYWRLACDAVSLASAAFNDGDNALVSRLCAYAMRINPRVRWSSQWLSLMCKRCVGLPLWRLLVPAVTRLRG
jgi:hypothetical protein